jgi:hypothetical protein
MFMTIMGMNNGTNNWGWNGGYGWGMNAGFGMGLDGGFGLEQLGLEQWFGNNWGWNNWYGTIGEILII